LHGDCSCLAGDCSGLHGDCSCLLGNLNLCIIDKINGTDINTLIKE
jgi:hypothetical protein